VHSAVEERLGDLHDERLDGLLVAGARREDGSSSRNITLEGGRSVVANRRRVDAVS
jgi:hypothetical protein